ncbi:MAG TPA: ATP-binding protein [Nevskiales bacterium]|nr:ATP-binding protein [Nevskiales bacterium]
MHIRLDFSPEHSLRSLCLLRGCAILGLIAAILGGHYGLDLTLPVLPMMGLALGLSLLTLLTLWRLTRAWPVTQPEIALQLAVDTLALTALFALSGGPGNPFVSFYLVPIAIGAVMLSRSWAWAVTLLSMLLYGTLIADFAQHLHHQHDTHGFQLHVLGMWLNFLLSAVLVTTFVTTVAEAVRRRDRTLAAAREEALRNEQILAVGTLAAGAAHELSTPLSTMAITIAELRAQYAQHPQLQAELDLLRGQIEICRSQLEVLLAVAGRERAASGTPAVSAENFLRIAADRCRLMRPELKLQIDADPTLASLHLHQDPALTQSVLAALNNAADASLAAGTPYVELRATTKDEQLIIEIGDRGAGLRPEQRALAGRGVFTTKPDGHGLGLVLSHATLERLGGEMRLEPRPGGGTLARIGVPLQALRAVQGKCA